MLLYHACLRFLLWVSTHLCNRGLADPDSSADFLPVILAGGGYNTKTSLLLSAPPYVFAAIYTFAVAYGSDKTRRRAVFIALNALVCTIGLFIMAFGGIIGVRYFGSFLAIAGCQGV